MLKRVRETKYADKFDRLNGAAVYGSDGEKVGTVDDLLIDPDQRSGGYAVVDSGGWLRSRRFVVPLDYVQWSERGDGSLQAPLTTRHIETLPEWNENDATPGELDRYEGLYRTAWTSLNIAPRPAAAGGEQSFFERQGIRSTATNVSPGRNAVYGVYTDQSKLESAVDRLKEGGFQNSDISVVFPDQQSSTRFAVEHSTKGPEGATAGGGTGMIAGGVLGWLVGIGTLAIPGIGPLIAAGPIVAALAGAGAGGAVGGLAGGLIGLGMPELEAKRYEREIKEGRMLLSVGCDDPRFAVSARTILRATGASEIFESGEQLAA